MNKGTYKKPTAYTATRTLQRFFANYPDANALTAEEILAGVGRNTEEFAKKNDGWMSNRLTALYAHGYVRPVYSFHPWRKLERLELTQKGKAVLNRDDAPGAVDLPNTAAPAGPKSLPYSDLVKAIASFKRDNPDFDVKFEVKLKEELAPIEQG